MVNRKNFILLSLLLSINLNLFSFFQNNNLKVALLAGTLLSGYLLSKKDIREKIKQKSEHVKEAIQENAETIFDVSFSLISIAFLYWGYKKIFKNKKEEVKPQKKPEPQRAVIDVVREEPGEARLVVNNQDQPGNQDGGQNVAVDVVQDAPPAEAGLIPNRHRNPDQQDDGDIAGEPEIEDAIYAQQLDLRQQNFAAGIGLGLD